MASSGSSDAPAADTRTDVVIIDDPLVAAMQAEAARSVSGSPNKMRHKLNLRARRKNYDPTNPLGMKQIFLSPEVGTDGFPIWRSQLNSSRADWNDRHHLSGTENELLPKRLRRYFSVPSDINHLKAQLQEGDLPRGVYQPQDLLRNYRLPDLPQPPRSPITADTGAPLCPGRYVPGGTMRDREGKPQPWDDKFHFGTALHSLPYQKEAPPQSTRGSDSGKSTGQRWRRGPESEALAGAWKPSANQKARHSLTGSAATIGSTSDPSHREKDT